ncbi:hypothetical protein AYK26_01640 [Euryarchaeota archaeon SM23-78]|nr:MAG: hypothetical protein AYK26_01640 [Euryarchaeota archaeon SM23-78]MBW3000481.1 hypothetical protein [Candidatus Woesearchaeota archaeon]
MTKIDELISLVGKHLEKLDRLNHHQIAQLIMELENDPPVWKKIPSGNRNYLERALQYYRKDPNSKAAINFMTGAKPHLRMAWPHRAGFIASKELGLRIGDPIFDSVMSGEKDLEGLSGEQLMDFAKRIENHRVLSSLRAYKGSRRAVKLILQKYDRLFSEQGRRAAAAYAQEKRQSLLNIFKKTYLPNLAGAIARGEIRL